MISRSGRGNYYREGKFYRFLLSVGFEDGCPGVTQRFQEDDGPGFTASFQQKVRIGFYLFLKALRYPQRHRQVPRTGNSEVTFSSGPWEKSERIDIRRYGNGFCSPWSASQVSR